MRSFVKAGVEGLLVRSGMVRLARRFRRGQSLVLAYHNVVPDDAEVHGDASLHIRQSRFESHLAALRDTHEIVPLAELSAPPGGSRPRIAITFDDAYTGTLTAGLEVLEEFGFPATVFVVPAFVGGPPFWWDQLAAAGQLTPETREDALTRHRGEHARIMEAFMPGPLATDRLSRWDLPAPESQLERALSNGLIRYGSHTWSHPNLDRIRPSDVEIEAARSMEWLRDRFPQRWVSALAFPYGRWSQGVAESVRRVGYRMAFRIDGGWTAESNESIPIPRLNVPAGLSANGLALRAGGVSFPTS